MSELPASRPLPDEAALAWSERAGLRGLSVRRGRVLAVAAAMVVLAWSTLESSQGLRLATFDAWQRLFPRTRVSAPAVIVAIDEASLAAHGQWPWPRTLMAALIERIAANGPAAVGVDVVFAEPDRLSPEQLAPSLAAGDPVLARRLSSLPTHDGQLAHAMEAAPVVLAMAGLPGPDGNAPVSAATPILVRGPVPANLASHGSLLRSIPTIDRAARGRGLVSAEPSGRVVRRVPLVSRVDGTLVPAFSIELLRVAAGLPSIGLATSAAGVRAVELGDLRVRTDRDAAVWVHYSTHAPDRFVSAADVLSGRVSGDVFERKLVIIGLTAIGVLDFHAVPTGERVPGSEIHAQILEGIFDGDLLRRPSWLPWLEAVAMALIAALAVFGASRWRPRTTALAWLGASGALVIVGALAMRFGGVLLDVAWPLIGGGVTFAMMLVATVAESDRQRRVLRRALDTERIASARDAGEQEAARRVQMGMLPPPDGRGVADPRISIAAMAEPARSVGGDLYDYFLLDDDRLFLVVGDVSGKGLPAALFMSVAKALLKSAALRGASDLESIVDEAHAELSRDNPGQLFVTLFVGILQLDTGTLEWCNAGHEPPLVIGPGGEVRRVEGASGPPLCVIESYPYDVNRTSLEPGERLCVVTDGITEAHSPDDQLLGRERFAERIGIQTPGSAAIRDAIASLLSEHGGERERADDATALVVEWRGTAGISAP